MTIEGRRFIKAVELKDGEVLRIILDNGEYLSMIASGNIKHYPDEQEYGVLNITAIFEKVEVV